MKQDDINRIYSIAKTSYNKAKEALELAHGMFYFREDSAISDVIPGYKANQLKFGSYTKDNFAVLFVDMRGSTRRAISVGEEQTFLTMHIYIPALLEVIKLYHGNVIDIMGDGLMVFFGGSKQDDNIMTKDVAIKNAAYCSLGMMTIKEKVINRILNEEKMKWPDISIGIGVTYGDVIVTKIGINDVYDVKAFGDCVNKASKYSGGDNKIHVSNTIRDKWPKGKDGTLKFIKSRSDDGYYVNYEGVV